METIKSILGFEPNKELMELILNEALKEGKPVLEVASKYALPGIFIDKDNSGFIDTEDEGRIRATEYENKHPYRKTIIIKAKD